MTAADFRKLARGLYADTAEDILSGNFEVEHATIGLGKACDLAADVLEPSEEMVTEIEGAILRSPVASRLEARAVLKVLAARLGAE